MQKKSPKSATTPRHANDGIDDFSQVNFITVGEYQDGQRLDNFLLSILKGLPRSHLYKLIRDGQIRLNKKRCKPHERLSVGDVLRVAPVRLGVRDKPVISDAFAWGLLNRIVYEDDGLMVLNKVHGLAVHGGSGESFGVIEAIRVATGKKYLELVHRIDKDTSGLLLIAKKRSILKDLQEQFRDKTIKKDYLCVVHGTLKSGQTIDKPLLKYTLANGERRVKVDKDGKPSQTLINVLTNFDIDGMAVSLIKASPKTGRTHQIRVHMASMGHALLGDDKYQSEKQATLASQRGIGRLCLHAWRLTLADGKRFEARLSDDMADLLKGAGVDKCQNAWSY